MSELAHYGVKGMKWGVRRAELNKRNPNYSAKDRSKDQRNNTGINSVKRINRRMNKGQTLEKARKNEVKFKKRRRKAAVATIYGVRYRRQIAAGAKVAGTILSLTAGIAAQSVARKAETNRGRAAAANAMGLPRTASTGPNYSKQKRNGVYDISSM